VEAQILARHLGPWSAGKGSLQQKLALALTQAVRHGALNPGSRLPSERSLAQALTLSRTTVVAAYDSLREAGWFESRSGSGTWVSARSSAVSAARGAEQAGALSSSPMLGLLARPSGEDLLDLALGTPPALPDLPDELFTLPPDEYRAMVRDSAYHPLGLSSLREALATAYTRLGLQTAASQVLVTNGAQHAIALASGLFLQRGDAALVENPAFFGAIDAMRAAGARIFGLPVETAGVAPSAIRDRVVATAARLVYLTPTFQNPTGAVMPAAARKEIARFVSELGVPLIDDRTIADIVFEGTAPPPLAAYAPAAPILTIGSLSKVVCPALRIGWIRAPEPLIERLARLKTSMDLASPAVTQAIAVRLLASLDQVRELRRRQLQPRRDLAAAWLRRHLPEWKFRVPSGGLFFWARIPHGDSRELAQVALRHGVVILPGPAMSVNEEHADYLRLPFLTDPATLHTALGRLAAAWKEYSLSGRREHRDRVVLV
jgi:DNA-binding transcriptional MocR family regulator